MHGGTGPNAIPREAAAEVVTTPEPWAGVAKRITEHFEVQTMVWYEMLSGSVLQEMLRDYPTETAAVLELVECPSAAVAEVTELSVMGNIFECTAGSIDR